MLTVIEYETHVNSNGISHADRDSDAINRQSSLRGILPSQRPGHSVMHAFPGGARRVFQVLGEDFILRIGNFGARRVIVQHGIRDFITLPAAEPDRATLFLSGIFEEAALRDV